MTGTPAPWIRIVLAILAVFTFINGVEMFFFPHAWFFDLVPGVPETGAFNAHLVADGGTFNLALGVGLAAAAIRPYRYAIAVLIAAIAGAMHSLLHIYSHAEGLLSSQHLQTEVLGIYIPTAILCALAFILMSRRAQAE